MDTSGSQTRPPSPGEVTRVLHAIRAAEPGASDRLLPLVYEELRRLAHTYMNAERAGQTLQATALVHEAYLRLVADDEPTWNSRGHFYGAAAQAMRRILVEQARRRRSLKRGGARRRVDLDVAATLAGDGQGEEGASEVMLRLDRALDALAAEDPRKAEVVMLKYFAGLTNDQAAQCLGVSSATVRNDWTFAKAWLLRAVESAEPFA